MKRKINFNDEELKELIQVMRICQPVHGHRGAGIGKIIAAYFTKNYIADLKTVPAGAHNLPSLRESNVEVTEFHWIPFDHILDELIDRSLLVKEYLHMEDLNGNKLYRDDAKTQPQKVRVFKVV